MANRYSILFLIDILSEGGAELALLALVRALSKKHNIYVFSLRRPSGLYSDFIDTGATIFIPEKDSEQSRIDGFKRLKNILQTHDFDFIHAGSRNTSMLIVFRFLLPIYGHTIVTFQEVHFSRTGYSKWQKLKEYVLLLFLLKSCDGFTTDSKTNVREYRLYSPKIPVVWIPNCLPPVIDYSNLIVSDVRKTIQASINDFLIIIPARYSIQKGHIVFFSALKLMQSNGVKIPRVICYGSGDQNFLSTYLKENKLERRVSLHGMVKINDLQRFMVAADLIVLPSLRESFGQVVAGAMALGKPVLGSDTGGISEQIIHNKNGFLAPPGDAIAWYKEVVRLMNSRSLLYDIGVSGKDSAQNLLSSDKIADRLIMYYKELEMR